jgi:hypothetical protein
MFNAYMPLNRWAGVPAPIRARGEHASLCVSDQQEELLDQPDKPKICVFRVSLGSKMFLFRLGLFGGSKNISLEAQKGEVIALVGSAVLAKPRW